MMERPGIGVLLKMHRERRGWSQRQLAQRARVSNVAISDIERGRVKGPGTDVLEKLAGALGIQLEELLRGVGDSSLSQGERGLAVLSEREQEMIRIILTSIQTMQPYVEDLPGLLEMWAALPPALMIAVADIIHVEFLRSQLADSGKVTRAHPGRRRTKSVPFTPWDMIAPQSGEAHILGEPPENEYDQHAEEA